MTPTHAISADEARRLLAEDREIHAPARARLIRNIRHVATRMPSEPDGLTSQDRAEVHGWSETTRWAWIVAGGH